MLSSPACIFVVSAQIRVHPRLISYAGSSAANSLRTSSATDRTTRLARDLFSFRKYAQKILAKNFANILFGVTPLQQFVGDVRQHRNVARAFGEIVRAFEIRSDADVIDARDLYNVIDVIDEL